MVTTFNKLASIVNSSRFIAIRQRIIRDQLFQRKIHPSRKFQEFCEEMGFRLIWDIEVDFSIRNDLLRPCYQSENKIDVLEFKAPKTKGTKYLESLYFHEYKILEVFGCVDHFDHIRDMLMIWWRRDKNKREALKNVKNCKNTGFFKASVLHSLCEFAVALEPIYSPEVRGRVLYRNRNDENTYFDAVDSIKADIIDMTSCFSKEEWGCIHDKLNFFSHVIDKGDELKTLITLMRDDDQTRIKGKLGASIMIREMASLIRSLAKDQNVNLLEEQFSESKGYTNAYFTHLRGSKQIVNGSRENKLKFIRGFGLDYSIRARLYVEGATENSCFRSLFGQNGVIEIINLAGEIAQKGRKGVAFRESLINDKAHHIYSLIVIDGDQLDYIRLLRDAAKNQEFLGQFYICSPDFEFSNFSHSELCEIINAHCASNISVDQISSARSGKDLFKLLGGLNVNLKKGDEWGEILASYAFNHPKTDPLGMTGDRIINQVIRFYRFSTLINFANDLGDRRINPQSGLMENIQ